MVCHDLEKGKPINYILYSNPKANVDKYLITFAGFYLLSISPAKFNTGLKHGMGKCEEKQLGHFLFWVKYCKFIWTSSCLKPIVWLSRRLFGSNVNPKHKTWLIYINKISFFEGGLVKSKFIIFFIFPFYRSGQVPCKKPFSTWIFPRICSKASTIRYAIWKPWVFRTPRLCFPWKSSHRLCPSDPGGGQYSYRKEMWLYK